ncbi:hypothetical protein QJS66_13330 [Kocuria rhizophila]|nr:hypothetical protein QJS66_13330 [Kocuria rhizophila]
MIEAEQPSPARGGDPAVVVGSGLVGLVWGGGGVVDAGPTSTPPWTRSTRSRSRRRSRRGARA